MDVFDVNVNGSLYDVSFVDGTCVDHYRGCDDADDFSSSSAETRDATEAP